MNREIKTVCWKCRRPIRLAADETCDPVLAFALVALIICDGCRRPRPQVEAEPVCERGCPCD